MLVSIPSGVCETSKNMGDISILQNSGSDISLNYKDNCHSQDVDWPPCTSSWSPYDLNMGEMSDVLSRGVSSTCHRDAVGKPFGDLIVTATTLLFIPENLTPF